MSARGTQHYVPASKIRAAYTLYCAGFSVPWIASQIWRRYGFASEKTAMDSLYKTFKRNGWPVRSISEVNQQRHPKCDGCGCATEERTRGCNTCVARHSKRRRSGYQHVPGHSRCLRCGGSFDERTYGCPSCASRMYWRARREKAAA